MVSDQIMLRSNGRVVTRKIGSDVLLVPVSGPSAGGRVFPVNESALVVWNALVDGASLRDAAGALVAKYGIDEETALADSEACARCFLKEKLLKTDTRNGSSADASMRVVLRER